MTMIFMLTTVIAPLVTSEELNVSKENLAQETISTQSSTDSGGDASRAVYGNTNGNYGNLSVSHMGFDSGGWWMGDLGENYNIDKINIFARTDGAPHYRLNDYNIYVLDENQNIVWQNYQTTYLTPMTSVNASGTTGRYVKVQLTGKNYLSLAEVQVYESEYPKFDK